MKIKMTLSFEYEIDIKIIYPENLDSDKILSEEIALCKVDPYSFLGDLPIELDNLEVTANILSD